MEKERFIEQIRLHKNKMYMIAYSILNNHSDAEDIVQEALLAAYKKLHTLKDDKRFGPWMMKIVVNQAKMYIRKNAKIIYVEEVQEQRETEALDADGSIWDVVMKLKENLSTVVILYYEQGYSVKEISEILGIPEGTVKSRLSKARELLRERLED